MKNDYGVFKIGCLLQIIIFAIYAWVGTLSVEYILSWFNKDIPLIGDIIVGIIGGEIAVPVAIIGWILKLFGAF